MVRPFHPGPFASAGGRRRERTRAARRNRPTTRAGATRDGVPRTAVATPRSRSRSCGPARLLRLPGGTLGEGSLGDVTVLDLEAEVTVEPVRFRSRGRNTPFADWHLRGIPVATFVAGARVRIP